MSQRTPNQTTRLDSLENAINCLPAKTANALYAALAGKDISIDEASILFSTSDREMETVAMVADELRKRSVGELVTYVVNRNINFTNVCIKQCGFCAFSRDHRDEQSYFLPIPEITRRAREAWSFGATEVCIQAGLPPHMDGKLYIKICEAIKKELPSIHIHGFSPEEVLYGSIRSRCSIKDYLRELKHAGVDSLPGTSAEVLDQSLRDIISPGRIRKDQWIDVITTAHKLGIPTTSTLMYGHTETTMQKIAHIALIRDLQKETGGFTEFVPLSFIHSEAPMYQKKLISNVRPGAKSMETIKVHAISRIMLNNWVPNVQVSWVKEGLTMSKLLLGAGVNDLGGTLMNESISTSAGSQHGQLVTPYEFRQLAFDCGRIPAERYTNYKIKQIFNEADIGLEPLNNEERHIYEKRFGSYKKLVKSSAFRYKKQTNTQQSRKSN